MYVYSFILKCRTHVFLKNSNIQQPNMQIKKERKTLFECGVVIILLLLVVVVVVVVDNKL